MTDRRVALRMDAAHALGMGHLMRMRDLAQNLTQRGIDHIFVCQPDSQAILQQQGIPTSQIVLTDTSADWVKTADPSHIVTDIMWSGNAQGAATEISGLTATGVPVTVIDSMPPDHFVTPDDAVPPACVVTPYLDAERLRPAPRTLDWAAGVQFAIIDSRYLLARARVTRPLPDRILVSCGGSDPTGLSLRIAQVLAPTGLGVDLVIGPLYPQDVQTALGEVAAQHPTLALHPPQPGLISMLERVGLVIGRVGLLRYQAAILGRTGIYLFEGPQYREYLRNFADKGLAEVFFADPPDGDRPFLNRLAALSDPAVRAPLFQLNTAAMAAVHGNGAANVIDRVLKQKRIAP